MNGQHQFSERRSVQWVEKLLQPLTSTVLLLEANETDVQVQYIEPRHYQDVVEERFIERLCGWPLCGHQLGNIPTAKYHISAKRRVVLDISQRKKFCCPHCYRCSKYFSSQLSSLPVWARKEGFTVSIQLLEEEAASLVNNAPLEKSLASEAAAKISSPTVPDGCSQGYSDTSLPHLCVEIIEKGVAALTILRDNNETDSDDEEFTVKKPLQMKRAQVSAHGTSRMSRMVDAVSSWQTSETLDLLQHPRAGEAETTHDQPAGQKESPVFLPLLHNIAPHLVQRSLFMQQLKSNLTPVGGQLDMNVHQLLADISALVRTFRLSKDTITFRPCEWKVLICVMVQSLGLADVGGNSSLCTWLQEINSSWHDFDQLVIALSQTSTIFIEQTN